MRCDGLCLWMLMLSSVLDANDVMIVFASCVMSGFCRDTYLGKTE